MASDVKCEVDGLPTKLTAKIITNYHPRGK